MSRTLAFLAALALLAIEAAAEPPVPTISAGEYLVAKSATKAATYNNPPALVEEGWDKARCATVEYAPGILADLYWPAEPPAVPLPVVLFALNFSRSAFVEANGVGMREMTPEIVWLAEIANRGFLVVCPDPVVVGRDMAAIMKWVADKGPEFGADPARIALFAVSANPRIVPYLMTLPEAPSIKAMALYYSDLTPAAWSLPKEVALHVVKAGKDDAGMNARIDAFVKKFTEAGNPVEYITYPPGRHVFDWKEKGGEAAAVMAKTLDFFEARLKK